MLNVLINDSDALYYRGLALFIAQTFHEALDVNINILPEFTRENVGQADIVVLSLCQSECFTCFPELQIRQKGILFGLTDEKDPQIYGRLPRCFQGIALMSRRAPLYEMRQRILAEWHKKALVKSQVYPRSCIGCREKQFSPQQNRIMARILLGKSVPQIASEMRISDKTVYTHKYIAMRKFNLRNDYELVRFLNRLVVKNTQFNFLRDYIEMTTQG